VILVKRRYVVALCVVVTACALGLTAWVFVYACYLRSDRFVADVEQMLRNALGLDVRASAVTTPSPGRYILQDVTLLSPGDTDILAEGLAVTLDRTDGYTAAGIRGGVLHLEDVNASEWLRCFVPPEGPTSRITWEGVSARVSWSDNTLDLSNLQCALTVASKSVTGLVLKGTGGEEWSLRLSHAGAPRTVHCALSLSGADLAESAMSAGFEKAGRFEARDLTAEFRLSQSHAGLAIAGDITLNLVVEDFPLGAPLIPRAEIIVRIRDILMVGDRLKHAEFEISPGGRDGKMLVTSRLVQWVSYLMTGHWVAVPEAVGPLDVDDIGLVARYRDGVLRLEGNLDEFGNWITLDPGQTLANQSPPGPGALSADLTLRQLLREIDVLDHPLHSGDLPLALVSERIKRLQAGDAPEDGRYRLRSFPDRGLVVLGAALMDGPQQ